MKITIEVNTQQLSSAQKTALGTLLEVPGGTNTQAVSTEDNVTITTQTAPKADKPTLPPTGWEFAPKPGRRRSKAEIALHELELEKGRLLTPQEKGETEAIIETDEEAEAEAKAKAKNDIRINKMAEEVSAEAAAELAQEAAESTSDTSETNEASEPKEAPFDVTEDDGIEDTVMPGEEPASNSMFAKDPEEKVEETPKAESLDNIDSLFS